MTHNQLVAIRFVLRDLTGMQEIQALLAKIVRHPNPEWAPEADQFQPLVDRVSRGLFGITAAETTYEPEGSYSAKDEVGWEQHFQFAECYFGDDADEAAEDTTERFIWESLGWDVTDGRGDEYPLLDYFYRQMICAAKGLKGRLPDSEPSDSERVAAAEQWGAHLAAKRR
jgi:hypothetical protein